MQSLWLLTIKNLKLLVRSRSSALIIIFAPLLIILLLGLSYNNSAQFGLKIGVYSSDFTPDVESFIKILEEEEFTITKYPSSLESCINDIKRSVIHTCIDLPSSLEVDDNSQKIVTFHIDPSRINIVWMVQETVKSKFNIKSQEISQELTGNILSRLSETNSILSEKQQDLNKIKEKTNAASSSATTASDSLEDIDTGSDTNELLNTINLNLEESKKLLQEAKDAVNGAGIEDDNKRSEIKGYLDDAKVKINLLISADNTSDGSDVSEEIDGGLILELKNKIGNIGNALESVDTEISSITSSLQEASESINILQSALDGIKSNLDSQTITEADTITTPLVTKIERVSDEGTYLNYLFPALLVLVVMFSSLLLGTTLVMIEKNSPAFLRNFFLPVRKITFITSIYLTNLVLTLIEISVILGISLFFLKGSISVIPSVGLILFIVGSVFTFLGMTIGYIFSSEETGVLASISLGSILLFTSGILLPLEGIAPGLRSIIAYNPFVIAEKLVREIFIFDASLKLVAQELGVLIGYAVILFIIIWGIESLLHAHLSRSFMKTHHKAHVVKKRS
jgi:ABC-type multidrug transport system permease subunit